MSFRLNIKSSTGQQAIAFILASAPGDEALESCGERREGRKRGGVLY